MSDIDTEEPMTRMTAAAFTFGPASRTAVLAAAVSSRDGTRMLDTLLSLPERRYRDAADVRGQLALSSR